MYIYIYICVCVCARVYEGGFLKWGLPSRHSPWLSTLSQSYRWGQGLPLLPWCPPAKRPDTDLDICRWKVGKNDEQRSSHAMIWKMGWKWLKLLWKWMETGWWHDWTRIIPTASESEVLPLMRVLGFNKGRAVHNLCDHIVWHPVN